MTPEANKAVVLALVEVANGRDLSRLPDLLTEDFRLPPGDAGLDREGLAMVLSYYWSAFSDLHYTVEELVAEGSTVVAHLAMEGTQDGEYDGQPPTGRTFRVDEIDTFTMRDGRIAGYRIVWDELSFRRQLGLPLS